MPQKHFAQASRRGHNKLELLESRRLLAAAAAATVDLPGISEHTRDDRGLVVAFYPESHVLQQRGGFLTGKQSGRRADIARATLAEYADEMGLTAADTRYSFIHQQNFDASTGLTHVYFRQSLNGLTVRNTDAAVHIMSDGRILTVSGNFVPGMDRFEQIAAKPQLAGMIHPTLALRAAAAEFGLHFDGQLESLAYNGGVKLEFLAMDDDLSRQEIPVRAEYVPTENGLRLAWNFNLDFTDDSGDWYDISVDAQTGKVIWANNYTSQHDHDGDGHADHTADEHNSTVLAAGGTTATYNVYALPKESPYDGGRTLEVNPWEAAGTGPNSPSPYGWQDVDGIPGADGTLTVGNNVLAQDDANNNNGTDGLKPDGGAGLDFNFPIDLTQAPSTYRAAAVTQLYYYNNVLHDLHYIYGFNEQWWNFQTNNYGRGGVGNDEVQADAQDGGGTNNANFATPADGSKPRMQMYLWNGGTPNRDGDLDNGIVAHEYGHGVSNRITTRGAGQMSATQSRGMGEGWSDWWGLMFSQQPSDTASTLRGIGTYALFQDPNTGIGIRIHPYSYDTSINPITWGYYGSGSYTSPYGGTVTRSTAVHRTGTIWSATLWDMNWLLINKHGFDSNLYTGYNPTGTAAERAGNKLALKLVTEGLKLQPNNPSFTQSRDAILQADVAITGGANQNEIWDAFARRGLGDGAVVGTSATTTNLTLSFTSPWADPVISASTPTGPQLGSPSTLQFDFNQAMNQSSFSVLDDVQSFTGPGGSDVRNLISGFTWLDADSLRINVSPLPVGSYSIRIGPNILANDNGVAMDQDRDGTPGELTDDSFVSSFSVTRTLGPESFGYQAAQYPVQNVDLVIGAPGVTTLVNGSDDAAGTITLPAGTTFNYYGAQNGTVFANANGLITFGTSTTAFTNGDLTTTPTQAALAVLWDDWRTDQNTTGEPDSAVLWAIQGNWLVVEWSDVPNRLATDGTATFQALLELNTGSAPGRMIFNYPDITTANATQSNGASSSVGIKNSGTQGTARLLVAQNTASMSWVQSGSAVLVALDVNPPTVDTAAYQFDTLQRLTFGFNEDVVIEQSDVSIENLTTSSPLVPTSFNYGAGTFQARVNLSTGLDDGNYRVTINGSTAGLGVTDLAGNPLDGDVSGVAGGNYTYDFFFLRGDANRDRSVNIGDFAILAGNYNSAGNFGTGDFNYDGTVGIADFSILASKYNSTLPAPLARAGASADQESTRLLAAVPPTPFSGTRVDRLVDGVLGSSDPL